MFRPCTPFSLATVMCVVAMAAPASAQLRPEPRAVAHVAATSHAELQGTVLDDRGEPLAGAVVSAIGTTTAFAVSDREGRFLFR